MSKYIPGNQKHLTLMRLKDPDIAPFIQRKLDHRRLSDWYHKGTFYNAKNFCVHRYHCKKTNACGKIILCGVKCTSCPTCNQTCKDYEKERCSRLDRAPYVCNGCPMKINHCTIAHKYRYDARFADRKYRELLSSFPCRNKYDQASTAPKKSDHYSVDRSGTVTLSDPDQSSVSLICLSVPCIQFETGTSSIRNDMTIVSSMNCGFIPAVQHTTENVWWEPGDRFLLRC